MKKESVTRRRFLKTAVVAAAAAGVIVADDAPARETEPAERTPQYAEYLLQRDKQEKTDKPVKDKKEEELKPTESNIEGPFYRAGAPSRAKLYDKGEPGKVLVVSGTVVARNGRPLAGVVLDLWQASAAGRYDNDDPQKPPKKNEFHLRGKIKTDKQGKYQFETVWPAPYQVGEGMFRPSHIHVKVSHEGYKALTTQLYFKGDKYNKTDFFYRKSLELDPKLQGKGKGKKYTATYKFVLAKA
jgi:protocatechuate 3,4-dioxygenase beta subunit